jgi:hypothetical protein
MAHNLDSLICPLFAEHDDRKLLVDQKSKSNPSRALIGGWKAIGWP